MMQYKCRIYDVPGVPNMRDLGGYRTERGDEIKMGRFIRSTALGRIDAAAEAQLIEIGVDCVIDLRSSFERSRLPDKIENHDAIYFEHVPMLDYIQSNLDAEDLSMFPTSMSKMYCDLLDNDPKSFRAVFELFSDARFSCCLYHCTAGKDRTGVTTLLLLGLAGVPDDVIVEDYSYTQSLLPNHNIGPTPRQLDLPAYLFESNPETMRDAIAHLRKNYGGAEEYLDSIGIDGARRRSITDKMFGK